MNAALVPFPIRNIYCIGRNYAKHAAELNNPVPTDEPVLFLKTTSSLRKATDRGTLAFADEVFAHEVEIVFQVGKNVSLGTKPGVAALSGVAVGLDMTRREKQSELKAKGLPWVLAKSFTGAAILSDFVAMDAVGPVTDLGVRLHVGGELRQSGFAVDMIFSPEFLVNWLATFNELLPGDLIFTGTPEGVGPMKLGDVFKMELLNAGNSNVLIVSEGAL